jgi:CRISPR-associated protein Cas1
LGGTILTRRAQLHAYDDGRGAALSLAIADAKINNQAATLKYIAKSRKETDPDRYHTLREASIETASQSARLTALRHMHLDDLRAQLMAFEAHAAIHYWEALRTVVPETYGWSARTGRGAVDPVNSLLNYGYGILSKRVERAIVMAGLDPYAGFIHSDRPGKPSLIFDLMEEFRSVAVDRLVIGLVNRRYTVEMTEQGRLQEDVRKNFAEKMTEHLKATVRYEGARFPIDTVIGRQARRLAAHLRGETETYLPYRAEW